MVVARLSRRRRDRPVLRRRQRLVARELPGPGRPPGRARRAAWASCPDGKIVVAGFTDAPGVRQLRCRAPPQPAGDVRLLLRRRGQRHGHRSPPTGTAALRRRVAVQPDGAIVLAGPARSTARTRPRGAPAPAGDPDPGFSDDGTVQRGTRGLQRGRGAAEMGRSSPPGTPTRATRRPGDALPAQRPAGHHLQRRRAGDGGPGRRRERDRPRPPDRRPHRRRRDRPTANSRPGRCCASRATRCPDPAPAPAGRAPAAAASPGRPRRAAPAGRRR